MKLKNNQQKKAYFMIAPAIIILIVIAIYPLLQSLWDSFFDLKINSSANAKFVGFDNYKHYFISSSIGWNALKFTLFFTILSVLIELILGIIIATIMNKSIKAMNIAKSSLLVPLAIPAVVSALIWKFLFDSQAGFFANLLEKIHLISNSNSIMTTYSGLTFAAVFADMWKTMPFMIILFLIAMSKIDNSLYDASKIEGWSKKTSFFKITRPSLKPAILVAVLFKILDAFRTFDLIYVLTGGAKNTDTISTLAYKTIFEQMELGKGNALTVIAFICSLIISIVFVKLIGINTLREGWKNEK